MMYSTLEESLANKVGAEGLHYIRATKYCDAFACVEMS